MKSRFFLLATLAAVSNGAPQDRPTSPCPFDGFGNKDKLGIIARRSTGYFGCSPDGKCLPTALAAGDPLLVYRSEGNWTCGYLSQRKGAGPAWVPSKDIAPVAIDPAPPLAAWQGTWANGKDRIRIRGAESPKLLHLEGEATWHGNGDVVHEGSFAGDATLAGNHLHFVASPSSCTVDLTLAGKYLIADDNSQCGGMNVRFWGIWTRSER